MKLFFPTHYYVMHYKTIHVYLNKSHQDTAGHHSWNNPFLTTVSDLFLDGTKLSICGKPKELSNLLALKMC